MIGGPGDAETERETSVIPYPGGGEREGNSLSAGLAAGA